MVCADTPLPLLRYFSFLIAKKSSCKVSEIYSTIYISNFFLSYLALCSSSNYYPKLSFCYFKPLDYASSAALGSNLIPTLNIDNTELCAESSLFGTYDPIESLGFTNDMIRVYYDGYFFPDELLLWL